MKTRIDITFVSDRSLLKFIEQSSFEKDTRLWKARYLCKCGSETNAYISNVRTGKTLSCGCHRLSLKTNFSHGLSTHPLYGVWGNMYSRCYNKKVKSYKNYGGRGVTMCDEWRNSPEVFIQWGIENGWAEGLELDKDIKGDGLLYSPSTCIFVTTKENANNRRVSRRIEYNGQIKTLAEWAEELNMKTPTLHQRLKYWPKDRAFTEPLYHSKLNRGYEL